MRPAIGIQGAKQGLEVVDRHGVFGGSQPPNSPARRERQGKATPAPAERPAFELYNVDWVRWDEADEDTRVQVPNDQSRSGQGRNRVLQASR